MRKVQASKFAITQNGSNVVCRSSFLRRRESADVAATSNVWPAAMTATNLGDPCAPLVTSDALKSRLRGPIHAAVAKVFGASADAEIFSTVVEAVAIDVVNDHAVTRPRDDPMRHEAAATLFRDCVSVVRPNLLDVPTATRKQGDVSFVQKHFLTSGEREDGHLGILRLVDARGIECEPDAVCVHGLRSLFADALVTEGCQVEVVAVLPAGSSEADQLRAVRTGLAVVFHKVGMEVHPVFIPLG